MNLTRAQQLLVGIAALAILAAVGVGVRGRSIRAGGALREPVYTPPSEPAIPPTITVHVAGAVREPGLKVLPRGARVDDAVRAAGGFSEQADASQVNLAAPLDDGERFDVPALRSAPPPADTADPALPATPPRLLDLNAATAEELESLPGIGPVRAEAIVAHRHRVGGFRRIEDLEAVRGIGPKVLADIRPYVYLR